MKNPLKALISGLFLLCAFLSAANQEYAGIGDLRLQSGETIRECMIGYRIYGEICADSSNIILYPSWFGGTSAHIGSLISIHNFIDTNAFAVLAVDALGNGISSSPSNYALRPGPAFPEIRIADMVKAEYELLEKLHIKQLHAVVGGSMGAMQGFEFLATYPDMAKKAVLYVGTPRESAYDLLRWAVGQEMIELGRKYRIPESEYMLPLRIDQALNGRSPAFYAKEMTPLDAEDFLGSFQDYEPGNFPADNYYCQAQAIFHHDISHRDQGDLDLTAARISAKILIIVNKQDHLVAPWPAMDFAKKIRARTLILDNNRGHLGITYEIEKVRRSMHRFLK